MNAISNFAFLFTKDTVIINEFENVYGNALLW